MTAFLLSKLAIEGFRGINNEGDPLVLNFKTDAVNSLFAPNGLGKSSIFDALCYAIRGCIPRLDALPAAERPKEYYPNRFHTLQTARILLTFQPDDGGSSVELDITHDPAGNRGVTSPSGHPDPEAFLRSLDHDLVFLDHATFLEFISDSPLHRGRAFSSLLGLSKLSDFRQMLEVLSHQGNLNNDFQLLPLGADVSRHTQTAASSLAVIRTNYRQLLGHEVQEPLDVGRLVTEVSAALRAIPIIAEFFTTADLLTADFDAMRRRIRTAEGGLEQERLAQIMRSINELTALAPTAVEAAAQASLKTAIQERDRALADTPGPLLAQLYAAALSVLNSDDWDDPNACPACESELNTPLAPILTAKQAQFTAAEQSTATVRTQWQTASWVARARALENSPHFASVAPAEFPALDATFNHALPTVQQLEQAIARLTTLESHRQKLLTDLAMERDALQRRLPPSLVALTQQVEHAWQLRHALQTFAQNFAQAAAAQTRLANRQRWATFVRDASATFANAEARHSTTRTTALESQYKAMYAQITANPEIVPVLRRSPGSEELHLRLDRFYGLTDLSVISLLPESYRNALAISIYLSAALNTPRKARFIVLDDVTSSFDAGHQFQLMELLRNQLACPANPTGPQIILLSHDSLLEKYFDRIQNAGNWHHDRLHGLPPRGAVLIRSQTANRLRQDAIQFLAAGQVPQAEPLIRQYLEFKLLEIIRSVDIPVPIDFAIRDDRKMVDHALNAIKSAVDLNQRAGNLILSAQQQQDVGQVHVPALLGNLLTHYSTGIGVNLSPYVLQGMLDTVDQIALSFQYPCSCPGQSSPRYYKTLSQKHCRC